MIDVNTCSASTCKYIFPELNKLTLMGVSSVSKEAYSVFPLIKVLKPEISFLSLLT